MKFEDTSPSLLKRLDELTRGHHSLLQEDDEGYYLGEYTPRAGSGHSPTNKLIINYKKSVDRREHEDWSYKEKAINEVAQWWKKAIFDTTDLSDRVHRATLVPIPPSKAKNSPEYDDRNYRMLKSLFPKGDVRELILQKESREPLHVLKNEPRLPGTLKNNYVLNEILTQPLPSEIWLFDDTLVKGTHFRAAKEFLRKFFPNIPIVGFFIARAMRLTRAN
jgi:hypothetical protein